MSRPASMSGGCACGRVRYEARTAPIFAANCHCRDCQRASGSAYGSFFAVTKDAFEMKGEPSVYRKSSDAKNPIERVFCGACGSPLLILEPERPNLVLIHGASLDEPSAHAPAIDMFTASAQPWDVMSPERPKFPGMPPLPDDFGR